MLNFIQETWYNKNDVTNKDKRIPISADHLNRIEEGVAYSVNGINEMYKYWWKKKKISETKFEPKSGTLEHKFPLSAYDATFTFYYSEEISFKIDEKGEGYLELVNPTQISLGYSAIDGNSTLRTKLRNTYFMKDVTSGQEAYYMRSDGFADISGSGGYSLTFTQTELVTYFLVYSDIEYVSSDRIDAYPDGWEPIGQVAYDFLGSPFENSRDPLKIGIGYYMGDGSSNRLIHTLGQPVLVWLDPQNPYSTILAESLRFGAYSSYAKLSNGGFVVDALHVNIFGQTYYYVYFY